MYKEKGAAAIEFAVIGLVLMTVLISGIDFSRLFATSISLQNAARAGVELGLADSSKSQDMQAIEQATQADGKAAHIGEVAATARQKCSCSDGQEVSCNASCASKRTYMEVTAKVPYHTMGVYPFLPNPVLLTATVRMRSK